MKTRTYIIAAGILVLALSPALAMQSHDSQASGGGHGQAADKTMEHGAPGGQAPVGKGGTFTHTETVEGIAAEFQVMSLAGMNMTAEKGETHHIMVNLKETGDGTPIHTAVGKIKVIAPDKSEQESPLKNYSGILAANFTFKEPGKYGVICLVKNGDQKRVFKFWYNHM